MPAASQKVTKKEDVKKSRQHKIDLEFPIGRIGRMLRRGSYFKRISEQTPIFLASVLELLTGEVLDLAAIKAKSEGRQRIVPANIFAGIQQEKSLIELFSNIIISEGGFNENIPEELLHLKKKTRSRSNSQANAETADHSRSQSNSKKDKKSDKKKDEKAGKSKSKDGKKSVSNSKSRSKSKTNQAAKGGKSQKTSQAI
jgi:histone H2A